MRRCESIALLELLKCIDIVQPICIVLADPMGRPYEAFKGDKGDISEYLKISFVGEYVQNVYTYNYTNEIVINCANG